LDTQSIQLPAQLPADTPNLVNRRNGHQFALPFHIRQNDNTTGALIYFGSIIGEALWLFRLILLKIGIDPWS